MDAPDIPTTHKGLIEQVARVVCRKHHLYDDDRDDFIQSLWVHLLEGDCAVVRKHEGRCALRTYLTAVVVNFLRDYREKKWGKWRNSAAAKRLGPVAELLEVLVIRDGLKIDEACEMLRVRGITGTRAEFEAMVAQFPSRQRPRMVQPDENAPEPVSPVRPDDGLTLTVKTTEARAVRRVLDEALAALTAQQRLIVKLRFHDGLKLVTIAERLGRKQKEFYRECEALFESLRQALEFRHVTADQVRDLLDNRGLGALEDDDD